MRLKIILLVFLAVAAFAQSPEKGEVYAVAIDQDQLAGAADFSFLNHPLTAADRLFVRDRNVHRGQTAGRRRSGGGSKS